MADGVKSRRIIDVSSPDETAPHASARPVIISHKPAVQDPMVSSRPSDNADQASEHIPVARKSPQPQQSQPEIIKAEVRSEPLASEQTPVPPGETTPQTAHVKQLVHDKTYFSPVSQPPRRQGISWLLVLTFLAVLGGVAYALLIL